LESKLAIHHYSAHTTRIERYYRVAELADLTGISKDAIYAAIRSGELHATRPNGMRKCWRIAESEARRWLAACTE
jgi:excisionase family DNA binding protein